jgi:hypothetical protein
MALSSETRHALKVIHDYLAGQNEAVQYCLAFMADQVTQTSSGLLGGIQAGGVPSSHVVTDPSAEVFELNQVPPGSPTGSLSLNLHDGALSASWTVGGSTISVAGTVRCVESLSGGANDRFLFVVPETSGGFYVLSTTNI